MANSSSPADDATPVGVPDTVPRFKPAIHGLRRTILLGNGPDNAVLPQVAQGATVPRMSDWYHSGKVIARVVDAILT
jgi:hypothetical protein